MPLAKREQRLLAQIEQDLYADEPKLAGALNSLSSRSYAIRHITRLSGLIFFGPLMLIAAAVIHSLPACLALIPAAIGLMLLAALSGSFDLRRHCGRSHRRSLKQCFHPLIRRQMGTAVKDLLADRRHPETDHGD
jgi:hypothetical protein